MSAKQSKTTDSGKSKAGAESDQQYSSDLTPEFASLMLSVRRKHAHQFTTPKDADGKLLLPYWLYDPFVSSGPMEALENWLGLPSEKEDTPQTPDPSRIRAWVRDGTRNGLQRSCNWCSLLEVDCPMMKFCARCKAVPYCSVECQKNDWVNHKAFCTTAQLRKISSKLVTYLMANSIFNHLLEMACIQEFRIEEKYKNGTLDKKKPFIARLDVAVEPLDKKQFDIMAKHGVAVNLGTKKNPTPGAPPVPKAVECCLTLRGLESRTADKYSPEKIARLVQVGEELEEKRQRYGDPIIGLVILHIMCDGGGCNMAYTLPVYRSTLSHVRLGNGFRFEKEAFGEVPEKPYGPRQVLTYINKMVKNDHANSMQLRSKLTRKELADIVKEDLKKLESLLISRATLPASSASSSS